MPAKHSQIYLSNTQISQINKMLIFASQQVLAIYNDYVAGKQDIDISAKADSSPVTKADIAVHDIIMQALKNITPDVFCLSEESVDDIANAERKKLDVLWLLDPVDGTKAFIKKTGEFTINLALVAHEQVVASWLVVPTAHILYFVVEHVQNIKNATVTQSNGAVNHNIALEKTLYFIDFKAQKSLDNAHAAQQDITFDIQPLTFKNIALADVETIKVGISRSAQISDYQAFMDELANIYKKPVKIVQAYSAYKYVLMLTGDIDVYIRAYPTNEWDTASGQGLLENIGGALLNFRGNTFLYNHRDVLKNGAFVCFKSALDKANILQACTKITEED